MKNIVRCTIKYRNKTFDCWRVKGKWITDGYKVLNKNKVEIIKRIGTPKEIFA